MSTRRQLLQNTALTAGALSLASCERTISGITGAFGQSVPDNLTLPTSTEIDPEFHLLSRASFGAWPGELERAKKMGREAWIE